MNTFASASPSRILGALAEVLSEQGWHDLIEQLPPLEEGAPIRIAFVGPYNAGKSSLIAALTGDLMIPRSGKPESSEARRYRWQDGVDLVDLPGWFSGLDEHDDRANEDLRRNADLVVFVLTVELGDETIVESIDNVLGELGFADRSVVVVNKSLSEDSDPDVIREEVVRRLGRHDAVPVFTTDAQSFLDTISGEFDFDDESIQILTDSSGIEDLSFALNELVVKHGMSARFVAQSRQGIRIAEEASNRLVPDEVERAAIEQLDEFEAAIGDANDRLDLLVTAHVSRMESDISSIAEKVLTEPTMSDAVHEEAWGRACQPAMSLADAATKVLAELADTLGGTAVALDPGPGSAAPSKRTSNSQRSQGVRPLGTRVLDAMGIDVASVADFVAKAGKKVATEGAGKESLAYELAGRFQPKKVFKPYGRLNDAKKIKQGAGVVSRANIVVPAVEEIWGWYREDKQRRDVERSKNEVRQHYAKAAHDEAERVRSEFDDWRRETLAPFEEKLTAGRAPLAAVASEREATRQAIAALWNRLIDGLEASAS